MPEKNQENPLVFFIFNIHVFKFSHLLKSRFLKKTSGNHINEDIKFSTSTNYPKDVFALFEIGKKSHFNFLINFMKSMFFVKDFRHPTSAVVV